MGRALNVLVYSGKHFAFSMSISDSCLLPPYFLLISELFAHVSVTLHHSNMCD